MSVADQDPWNPGITISCADCGTPHEFVRPGKTQPTCDCSNYCRMHEPPVIYEYRNESHPVNVASKQIGYGMHLGYICPECEAQNDAWILQAATEAANNGKG